MIVGILTEHTTKLVREDDADYTHGRLVGFRGSEKKVPFTYDELEEYVVYQDGEGEKGWKVKSELMMGEKFERLIRTLQGGVKGEEPGVRHPLTGITSETVLKVVAGEGEAGGSTKHFIPNINKPLYDSLRSSP